MGLASPPLVDLVCRHVGTGQRADLPPSAHGALYAVPLIGRQTPDQGGHLERAALALLAVICSDDANEVPYRPEQLLRALWRAVEAVDFQPIDRSGRRAAVDAPKARWEAAFQHCQSEHIAAWFSVLWEDRLASGSTRPRSPARDRDRGDRPGTSCGHS